MNLSQLRAFVEVAGHGSFSAAAQKLSLSQPAVTMQVQSLEKELDATLFERGYRKVELTPHGDALLPYAREVLDDLDRARMAIEQLSDTVTGRLLVAASTTPGQYVLPRTLGPFLHEYPEVGINLDVRDTSEVVEAVEEGEADFGMTGARVRGAKVDYEQLAEDELVLVAPPDHELAEEKGLTLAAVAEESFILRERGSGTRMVMEEAFEAGGVDPRELVVVTELGTSEAIVTAVEGGLGLGVVSRWMADKALKLGTVVELDVSHFPIERPFYLVLPKGPMSEAAETFVEYLKAEL